MKATKKTIEILKAQVKADTEGAQRITKNISSLPRVEETSAQRESLWQEKRSGRFDRRHRLLAYAMAKGMPYAVVEAKCETPPCEYRIWQFLRPAVEDIDRVHWSRERIESWIAGRMAQKAA